MSVLLCIKTSLFRLQTRSLAFLKETRRMFLLFDPSLNMAGGLNQVDINRIVQRVQEAHRSGFNFGMEWSAGTIGGFCVGSDFIVEHQRLSGLGYCFSASLSQAEISALDRFESEPQIFDQLQKMTRILHEKFQKFSKLQLRGDIMSPVKHLYLAKCLENDDDERQLLNIN